MADPVNPYLPSTLDRLSTMLMALGSGISGAESRGQSGWAGIGPAAAMYGQANQQANDQAMRYGMWQQQNQQQEAYRKAQEENLRSQIDERKRNAAIDDQLMGVAARYGQGGTAPPGMGGAAPQPTIGPGADLLQSGPQKVAYLTDKYGLPPVGAAGVVGGLYQESRFNPTATHDGGRGYGMAGWDPNRTAALNQFAKMQGKPISDPQVQLDFVAHEGKNGDMGAQRAWAMLQTAKTPQEATTAMMHYFRPLGYTPNNPTAGHGYQQRVQYAQALLPNGQPVPQGDGGPPAGAAPGVPGSIAAPPPPGGVALPSPTPMQPPPQMPGPPPDQRGLAPFMLRPHFNEFGKYIQGNQNKQYDYNWKAYEAATKQQNEDRSYNFQVKKAEDEGQFVRGEDGVEKWVPQADLRGKTRSDKPPDAGTPAGDVALVSRAFKDPSLTQTPEYKAAITRLAKPELTASGQLMYPDMSAYPPKPGDAPPTSGPRVEDTPQARFTMEGKLADDFNQIKSVKDYREVSPIISSMRDAVTRDNRVADLNLIYGLAKLMDPTSVVREGEQIMVRNAQGLPDWVKGMISAYQGGSQFPPEQRKRIMQEAESRVTAYQQQYDAVASQFTERAHAYGLNPKNVITAPFAKADDKEKKAEPVRIDMSGNRK